MLSFLVSTLVTGSEDAHAVIDRLTRQAGFEYTGGFSNSEGAFTLKSKGWGFRNKVRSEGLSIEVSRVRADTMVEEQWRRRTSTMAMSPGPDYDPYKNVTMPLGERLYFWVGHSGASIVWAFSKEAYVEVITRRGAMRASNGTAVRANGWGDPEARMFEAITRWAMADEAGRAMTSQRTTIDGLSLSGLRSRSSVTLGNVREFASKKGYYYRLNEDTGVATMSVGSTQIVIPLASPKIKVGNVWRDLPHIIPAVGKDPYLPLSELGKW